MKNKNIVSVNDRLIIAEDAIDIARIRIGDIIINKLYELLW